eukprot:GHVH01003379.1.p1 GENE.GHVH01003379.1~~GHVH01003379.1.p1  ORF type:complete len:192 (+),score=18.69 GHVH01003379.1:46-621(+)
MADMADVSSQALLSNTKAILATVSPVPESIRALRKLFPKDPLFGQCVKVDKHAEKRQYQDILYLGDYDNESEMTALGRVQYPLRGHSVEGWIVKGNFDGPALVEHPSGCRFVGRFRKNQANGYGLYSFPDKTRHWGCFENNQLSCFGRQKCSDGTEFFGIFDKNLKEGPGYAVLYDLVVPLNPLCQWRIQT